MPKENLTNDEANATWHPVVELSEEQKEKMHMPFEEWEKGLSKLTVKQIRDQLDYATKDRFTGETEYTKRLHKELESRVGKEEARKIRDDEGY